ncbi:riboflavin kinase [Mycena vitilis]|nr:riboflavin kinase [Mycena vitilis]
MLQAISSTTAAANSPSSAPDHAAYHSPNPVATRPLIIGPSTGPEAPFPLQMEGKVISGYGRGSKELGIPTANLPVDDTPWIAEIKPGVYFGWASLRLPPSHPDKSTSTDSEARSGFSVYPMVMSIGSNTFYNNTVLTAEAHVLHKFEADFYGVEMRLLVTGFIREMKGYVDVKGLIEDINVDCDVARKSLDREAYALRETGKGTLDGSWLVR